MIKLEEEMIAVHTEKKILSRHFLCMHPSLLFIIIVVVPDTPHNIRTYISTKTVLTQQNRSQKKKNSFFSSYDLQI